jgi:hypothetical protein
MKEQNKENNKIEGPLGIRLSVWLIVVSTALMCMLMISLPSRYESRPSPDAASESLSHQETPTRETRSRRAARMEFAPATESGAKHHFDEAVLALVEQMTQDRSTWWDSPHNLP